MKPTVALIVAADERDVIGAAGRMPWHLPEDLKRFRKLTTGHVVVAGRRTQDSIVERIGRPLPDRITVVVTRNGDLTDGDPVYYRPDVETALSLAQAMEARAGGDTVFVIGGAEIYAQALPRVDIVHLTRVHGEHDGDAAMPPGWLDGFEKTDEEHPEEGFSYLTYVRR